MVEERNLALVRSQEPSGSLLREGQDSSKDELQHRMEVARESISHTVDEIKDTMVNQYESVKESVSKTLDWHEQVKRRPVTWGVGALGAGFVVGYGVAAVVKGPGKVSVRPYRETPVRRTTVPTPPVSLGNSSTATPKDDTPGLVQRLQETPAYDRLKQEAAVVGNRFVDEISKKAQEVVLPAAIAWIGTWIEGLLPATEKRSKAN